MENTCPHCNKNLRLAEDAVGKTVRCHSCKQEFIAYCMELDAREEIDGDFLHPSIQSDTQPQAQIKAVPPEDQISKILKTLRKYNRAHLVFKVVVLCVCLSVSVCGVVYVYLSTPPHPDSWSEAYTRQQKAHHTYTYETVANTHRNYIRDRVLFVWYVIFMFIPLCAYSLFCRTRVGVYLIGPVCALISICAIGLIVYVFTSPPSSHISSSNGLAIIPIVGMGIALWAGVPIWIVAEEFYFYWRRRKLPS